MARKRIWAIRQRASATSRCRSRPTRGKTVRIELAGAIEEKDEFGLVEVTGKKLADAAGKGAAGKLEVIEAEIYEPLTVSTR